ncbi:MAG: pilus assembly protein TadG-related protein [Acidimicrobiia bacterium]|nr:pilus assembly protein TadG-related protein [Acidimicrobiia bacterium]
MRIRWRNDDGVTLPLVALMLVVIMGMASLVVDLGSGWRTRRALIPATDAAALAAAQDYAQGLDGCSLSAGNYLASNEGAAVLDLCDPHASGTNGYVTVAASHNVQTWFAAVLGLGDYTVTSASTAAWSDPSGVNGLRPLGLCLNGDADLQNAVYNPDADPVEIVVEYTKEHPNDCGSTTGNWGPIDLDGNGNSHQDMNDWLLDGYPGLIEFSDHVVTSCTDEHCLEGDTGADLAGSQSYLNTLVSRDEYILLPLFNFVEGNGANARYHVVGIVRVKILQHKVVGAEDKRFLRLLVEPGFVPGIGGGSGSGTGGSKVVSICAVDATDLSGCLP